MTLEIAILNKNGICIGADSAVTFFRKGKTKIFYHAKKIIPFKNHSHLAALIYGDVSFLGLPVEIVLNLFDEEKKEIKFKTVDHMGEEFIRFAEEFFARNIPENEKIAYMKERIKYDFSNAFNKIKRLLDEEITKNRGSIKFEVSDEIVNGVLEEMVRMFEKAEYLPFVEGDPEEYVKSFIKKHEELFLELVNEVVEGIGYGIIFKEALERRKEAKENLYKLAAYSLLKKIIVSEFNTGIVLVGYGEEEIFPAIITYSFEGIIDNHLKFVKNKGKTHKISIEEIEFSLNLFGQDENAKTFIDKISPELESGIYKENNRLYREIINIISDKVNEEVVGAIQKIFEVHENTIRRMLFEQFNSFIHTIKSFSAEGLSEVVAMLLKIEAFGRRYTLQEESVGGDIRVATITKRDGFVWRKN